MDPLHLLREYQKESKFKEVSISGDKVSFGEDYDYPKNTATAYRSQQGQGEFYSLETLVVFLQNVEVQHSAYMRKTAQEKIAAVTFQDRKTLIDYLTGVVDTSTSIQYTADITRATAQRKRQRGPAGDDTEPSTKLFKIDEANGNSDAWASDSMAHERQLRTRQNMLVVPNKDFSLCTKLYDNAHSVVEKQIKAQIKEGTSSRSRQPSGVHPPIHKSTGRLERGPAQAPKEMKELGINIYGKRTEPTTKRPLDKIFRHALSGQYVDGHGMPCDKTGKRLPGDHVPVRCADKNQRDSDGKSKSTGSHPDKISNRMPVIIVPEGMSAIINMHNVQSFLQDQIFETTEDAKAKSKDGLKPGHVFVKRTHNGVTTVYYVTDKVPDEQDGRWNQVVAVICQGKKWQFKSWPFKGAKEGNLVETFASVCGFFFHWKDEDVPDVVKTWNVKVFPISRKGAGVRHHDVTVVTQTFEAILKFLDTKTKSGVRTGCRPEKIQYK